MATLTALNKSSGALRLNNNGGGNGRSAPAPHFDSILRAAPAYDDDDDEDNENQAENNDTIQLIEGEDEIANTVPPSETIANAIRPHLQHHSSLHAYLDANTMLEEMILATQERIYEDIGRLKSQTSELRIAEKDVKVLQDTKKKGVGIKFLMPKKKKDYKIKFEKALNHLDKVQKQVNLLESDRIQQSEHIESLKNELKQFKRVEARLDALDNQVFSGLTPDHPQEDELEKKYYILWQTSRKLQTSIQLEKRAQQHLEKALKISQMIISELLKGLNIGIEIGIATNTKHKTSLWKGTDPKYSARACRGLILRAKTLCGELHTHYISARAIQRRITRLPKLQVIELTRLPDQYNNKTVNELGLHRSLESSYAECKIAKAHIERELVKSKSRQKKVKQQIIGLEGQSRSVWLELRQIRRNIIEEIRIIEPGLSTDQPLSINELIGDTRDLNRPFNPSIPPSAETSQRPSMSGSLFPPPYRREFASQSSLGINFPPLTTTDSGTLADFASSNDWEAREKHRLITLPRAFRTLIEKESLQKSRQIVTKIAIEVGGIMEDDDDLHAADAISTPDEEDLPGFHLAFQ